MVWFSKSKAEYVVLSLAYNDEFGTHAGAGIEKKFSADEMMQLGWQYIEHDLDTFYERSPAPAPPDARAAIEDAMKRRQIYSEVNVSVRSSGSSKELHLHPMNVVAGRAGAIGTGAPVVISFPVTQSVFNKALLEAFNQLR